MTQVGQQKLAKLPQSTKTNPLAAALAELEPNSRDLHQNPVSSLDAFREALQRGQNRDLSAFAQTGMGDMQPENFFAQRQQEQELKHQQQQAALRERIKEEEKQRKIFDAREAQVKKTIEDLRNKLNANSRDVQVTNQPIAATLNTRITNPGEEGKGYKGFFDILARLIETLKLNTRDGGSWIVTGKRKQGFQLGGKSPQVTNQIQSSFMHHEKAMGNAGA